MNDLNLRAIIKKNPFLLAPMDTITDIAFRELCEEMGASYTCSELISIEALIRDKVPKYRYQRGNLKINCVQIFGSKIESFAKATKYLMKSNEVDIIDINFGCPSTSVTNAKSGSILLKDPKNVYEIVKTVVDNSNVPVTAKIRLGYTNQTYLEVAKEIQKAGASLITVHGRTAKQKYSGKANWIPIKEIYENLDIFVIGNGDISNEKDIEKIGKYSNGLMIGRSAIGNPYLFKKLKYYYDNKEELIEENKKEIQKKLFIQYLKKTENIDFYKKEFKIKQQAMWFTKGLEGSKEIRNKMQKLNSTNEIIDLIQNF